MCSTEEWLLIKQRGEEQMKRRRNIHSKKTRRSYKMHTCIAAAAAFVLILVMTICFTGRQAKAGNLDTPETDGSAKYYTSYQVQSGDTLWTIAEKYNSTEIQSTQSYVEEVCRINHLSDANQIYAGNKICIPYYQSLN